MQERLDSMPREREAQRLFLATYRRTTAAVGVAIAEAAFEDPSWVERWDVASLVKDLRPNNPKK